MSYYKRFGIILGNPLWRVYLRWRYQKSIEDFKKLSFIPNFNKQNFSCLLCGVGNEATAEEFIEFVMKKSQNPHIWIIDLGQEQIVAVQRMIKQKYPYLNINVKQINALDLSELIKLKSIDWIETDGFFEFFDNNSIRKLLQVWKNLLTNDGFITTTATSSRWKLQEYFDRIKIWIGRNLLGVTVYPHTRKEMRQNFEDEGLKYIEGPTIIPYFKRYSLYINK